VMDVPTILVFADSSKGNFRDAIDIGVPIEEEMSTLRFRMGMAEAENASLHGRSCTLERAEVYYECMEPFKSLMCLWVRNKSIDAIWLERVVTPLIEPAIKGFAAAPAVFKPEHLKVDKTWFKYFGRLCPNEIYRLISMALDSISAFLLSSDRRLERTATFSISMISE
nr:hypothetical protein [Tanacetum cinerariifolium]